MIETPWVGVVGGRVCVMMNLEPGEWNCIDDRPCSYIIGLFAALLVLTGSEGRKNMNMVAETVVGVLSNRKTVMIDVRLL